MEIEAKENLNTCVHFEHNGKTYLVEFESTESKYIANHYVNVNGIDKETIRFNIGKKLRMVHESVDKNNVILNKGFATVTQIEAYVKVNGDFMRDPITCIEHMSVEVIPGIQ